MINWEIKHSLKLDGNAELGFEEISSVFSPNGRYLCYRTQGQLVYMDLVTRKKAFSLKSPKTVSTTVSPDEKTVAVISYDTYPIGPEGVNSLSLYDMATGRKRKEFKKIPLTNFRFLNDGKRMLATYHDPRGMRLAIFDLDTGEVLGNLGGERFSTNNYTISPDGNNYIVPASHGGIKIFVTVHGDFVAER